MLIMEKPKVSICCWTYNHEKFIRDTLDGFVMQKTNFPFELIIHEDASTDSTADIIREYEAKYPDIIKPIYQTENQYSKLPLLEEHVFPKITGEYVAFCEGDDYWTDENKLQKQVDFLDANPDFSICFHAIKVVHEDEPIPDSIFPDTNARFNRDVLTIYNLLCWNFIQTNSVMYRWRFNETLTLKDFESTTVTPLDWYIHLLHAQVGKIKYLDETMGVYRRHKNGIWSGDFETLNLAHGPGKLKFFLSLEKYFPEYNEILGHSYTCKQAYIYFKTYLKHQKFELMQRILSMCPDCLNPEHLNDSDYISRVLNHDKVKNIVT